MIYIAHEKKLRILTVNFQSIYAKKEAFWSVVGECDPSIVLASETGLHIGKGKSEVLPANYRFVASVMNRGPFNLRASTSL